MCTAVVCKKCGKTTWSGCGQHIEQALAGVPESQRCQGHEDEPRDGVMNKISKLFGGK